ncbi:CinA domain-containing protein [Hyphomonas polymorpha PS728]|uniref:CinA domain-containing protein n=1 Tax=Hyphomonas polymorpha PS728 TaxID=1280954 RepID=A0A062V9Q1_9PROT|nr:CinA domain-containing protein [Hyphomonas polymorpha PS728]
MPLAAEIGDILKARRETVAISESSAGGLISAALLAAPGASRYYRGGGVIYTPQAFRGLLGLTREDLGDKRSSSEPYARMLAGRIRELLEADWGLCETGASGPTGNMYGDDAGHTCVALAGPGGVLVSRTLETGISDREANMRLFAAEALDLLRGGLG